MANRPASDTVPGEVTRLTNRAAALAFAAAFAIILALVSIPAAVRPGEPARRVAALVATALAAGVTTWAWRAHVQLRHARASSAPGVPSHGRDAEPRPEGRAPATPGRGAAPASRGGAR